MIGSFLASVATLIINYRRLVATLFIEMFFISCLRPYYTKLAARTCHSNCTYLLFFEVCSSSLL